MEKIYFEMNDKERQLCHVGDMIDYAISIFSEGLNGTGEYNIGINNVNELQDKIANQLLSVQADINILLKAVEDRKDRSQLKFNTVYGKEDLKVLKDCTVYHIENVENPLENFYGTEMVFYNKKKGKYISLLQDNDGELSISQWY